MLGQLQQLNLIAEQIVQLNSIGLTFGYFTLKIDPLWVIYLQLVFISYKLSLQIKSE